MKLHNLLFKHTAGSRPPVIGQEIVLPIRLIKVLKAKVKSTAVSVGRGEGEEKKGRGVQVIITKVWSLSGTCVQEVHYMCFIFTSIMHAVIRV